MSSPILDRAVPQTRFGRSELDTRGSVWKDLGFRIRLVPGSDGRCGPIGHGH